MITKSVIPFIKNPSWCFIKIFITILLKKKTKNYTIFQEVEWEIALRITEIEKNIRVSQRKRVLKNITVWGVAEFSNSRGV